VPAAASGIWASALRWSPSLLFGIPSGQGRLPASWPAPAGSPSGDSAPSLAAVPYSTSARHSHLK
jgi:hypothetical protein